MQDSPRVEVLFWAAGGQLESDVLSWVGAESRALSREESRGIRKRPIADLWREPLTAWENPEQEQDTGEETERDSG